MEQVVLPDGTLDMAKLDALKGGTRVCPGLRFGSLYDGPIVGGGFSSALAHHCKCSKCGKDMLVCVRPCVSSYSSSLLGFFGMIL